MSYDQTYEVNHKSYTGLIKFQFIYKFMYF